MKHMLNELSRPVAITAILLLFLGGAYPLITWGLAQVFFKEKADGSLLRSADGAVVGSSLLAQRFQEQKYFHSRPSAAGTGYDASASGGSNFGPTSAKLRDSIKVRVDAYRKENGLPDSMKVPADAVMASGSGLDPEISVANAEFQSVRVAKARNIGPDRVKALISSHTRKRGLGVLGEPGVNVLTLNLALKGLE